MTRTRIVLSLGVAQTIAWGATYYVPATLAPAMARDLGVDTATVYAAFSVALLVSRAGEPLSGAGDRADRRPVVSTSTGAGTTTLTLDAREGLHASSR